MSARPKYGEEFEKIFSEDVIFDGISPSGLRGRVVSMLEKARRKGELHREFWTDLQKVLEHFEENSPKPDYHCEKERGV